MTSKTPEPEKSYKRKQTKNLPPMDYLNVETGIITKINREIT